MNLNSVTGKNWILKKFDQENLSLDKLWFWKLKFT